MKCVPKVCLVNSFLENYSKMKIRLKMKEEPESVVVS